MSLISRSSSRQSHCALGALVAAIWLCAGNVSAQEATEGSKEKKPAETETTPEEAAPEKPAEDPVDEGAEAAEPTDEAPDDDVVEPVAATQEEPAAPAESAGEETASGSADADDESWMDLKKASEDVGDVDETPKRMPNFRTMLLIEGTVKYGGIAVAAEGTTLEDDDAEELRAGHGGAQVSLGIMPSGRAFMMGGRLRGGTYLGERVTQGNIAGEMFFGANFARNARGNEFTHISGGFGVEFIPAENQDLLTINISGGTVMNGVAFGAGLYGGANDEYAVGMFGMHIGWAQLY